MLATRVSLRHDQQAEIRRATSTKSSIRRCVHWPASFTTSSFIRCLSSAPLGADIPLIVVWLIAGGVFFTGYLRFVNVRGFMHAIRIVRGVYADPDDPGEISQFQALTTAVSGTVGIGNIAGVAVAISMGGRAIRSPSSTR
jgi:hypothetical protein